MFKAAPFVLVACIILGISIVYFAGSFEQSKYDSLKIAAEIQEKIKADLKDFDVPTALRKLHGRSMDDDISNLRPIRVPDRFERMIEHYGPITKHNEHYVEYKDRKLSTNQPTVLTVDNTAPLTIIPNFDQLYQATAIKYRSCFNAGDWFKWGYPSSATPPSNTNNLCDRTKTSSGQDCWGVCQANDVTTADDAAYLVQYVNQQITKFSTLLRARARNGNQIYTSSTGTYVSTYTQIPGYFDNPPRITCMADCRIGNDLPVDSSYCTTGVNGDIILFVNKMIPEPNVGGYGGLCQTDALSRPTAMYIQINVPSDTPTKTTYATDGIIQKLIQHEILHGLGFSLANFQSKTGLVNQQLYTDDIDKTSDLVWQFISGLPLEVGKNYFGCPNLPGLPLMGTNVLGAGSSGSHWETRIMADEVLSYSNTGIISDFTLAVYEEMGYYLGNYSASGCMEWGAGRGCKFVTQRCGDRTFHDYSQVVIGNAVCNSCASPPCSSTARNYFQGYQASFAPWTSDPILGPKCGKVDCGSPGNSPSQVLNLVTMCDTECFFNGVLNNNTCKSGFYPVTVGATTGTITNFLNKYGISLQTFEIVLEILCPLLILCCCTMYIRSLVHNEGTMKSMFDIFSSLFVICILAFVAGGIYGLVNVSTYELYISEKSMIVFVSGCCIMLVAFALGLWGANQKNHHSWTLIVFSVTMLLLLLAQLAAVIFIIMWGSSLSAMAQDTAANLGVGGLTISASSGAQKYLYSTIDAWMCNTYRTCCTPPLVIEKLNGTCTALHPGQSWTPQLILGDPSQPSFCYYLTGSNFTHSAANGTCAIANTRGVIDLATCQANFCLTGISGYLNFLDTGMQYFLRNMIPIGSCLIIFMSVQFLVLVTALGLYFYHGPGSTRNLLKGTEKNKAGITPRPPSVAINNVAINYAEGVQMSSPTEHADFKPKPLHRY